MNKLFCPRNDLRLPWGAYVVTSGDHLATGPRSVPRRRQMVAEIAIPLVAIGGINLDNMAEVKATGIKNVAMVREFQDDTAAKVAVVNSFFN